MNKNIEKNLRSDLEYGEPIAEDEFLKESLISTTDSGLSSP